MQKPKNPKRPVTAIIGGAKVSSKLSVIVNMLNVVDNPVIGGGMAYTFIKNNGGSIGDSIFEKDCLNDCTKIIEQAKNKGVNIYLPTDVIASNEFSDTSLKKEINIYDIPEGWQGLDIGTQTRKEFKQVIFSSKTILWNGPMGVFEGPLARNQRGSNCCSKSNDRRCFLTCWGRRFGCSY